MQKPGGLFSMRFSSFLYKSQLLIWNIQYLLITHFFWISWSISIIENKEANESEILAVGRDITSHKKKRTKKNWPPVRHG